MTAIQQKLEELGIVLPAAPKPVALYVPARQSGNLLFVSGQLPVMDGRVVFSGKVNRELDTVQGREAARLCVVNCLAVMKQFLTCLERVKGIIKLEVYVNAQSGFTDHAQIANGASQLLNDVFGSEGAHARVTIGVSDLPLGAAVEVALIAEIR